MMDSHEIKEAPPESSSCWTFDDFIAVVKNGGRTHLEHIIKNNKHLIFEKDVQGNTCMHWAAKRGDRDILSVLYEYGSRFDIPSDSSPHLLPFHWAAGDGCIDALEFFLEHGQNINSQDTDGCSAAVIAAQYDQTNTLIYLAKHGADLTLRDQNGDSCLHWAAYKGHREILEVVLYFVPNELNVTDQFGQSALQLGCSRGNSDIVDILLRKYHADYVIRDKSNRTALDIAIEKQNVKCEWFLRKHTTSSSFTLLRDILTKRFKEKQLFVLWIIGSTDREVGAWLWRITFGSNFYATIVTFQYIFATTLADLYYLHLFNLCIQVLWWLFFLGCLWKEPGYIRPDDTPQPAFPQSTPTTSSEKKKHDYEPNATVSNNHSRNSMKHHKGGLLMMKDIERGDGNEEDDELEGLIQDQPITSSSSISSSSSLSSTASLSTATGGVAGAMSLTPGKLYDMGLDIIARLKKSPLDPLHTPTTVTNIVTTNNAKNKLPYLCHTCRIQRPLRSKHCRAADRCVYKFDHFCPFVYNTIGRDNYKYFYGLLCLHPWAFLGFALETFFYWYRNHGFASYWYYVFVIYASMMCLAVFGLFRYHSNLVRENLTTNEDINVMKYEYLLSADGKYSNPFSLYPMDNISEVLVPLKSVYYVREEIVRDRQKWITV